MPSNSYKNYLKTDYWWTVKNTVQKRDNFECQVCKNRTNLEVHHITYKVNGESILNNEFRYLKWLITLCENCHEEVHKDKNHLLNPKGIKVNANDFKAMFNKN